MNSTWPLRPSSLRLLAREGNLFGGNIERLHANAVLARHVQRQRSPAATRFDHRFSRVQLQLCGKRDPFSRSALASNVADWHRKIRAGVDQAGVEPQLIEVDVQVVVPREYFRENPAGCFPASNPASVKLMSNTAYRCDSGESLGKRPRRAQAGRRRLRSAPPCTPRQTQFPD